MEIYLRRYVGTFAGIALPILALITLAAGFRLGPIAVLISLSLMLILGTLVLVPWAILLGVLHIRLLETLPAGPISVLARSALLGSLAGLLPVAVLFGLPDRQRNPGTWALVSALFLTWTATGALFGRFWLRHPPLTRPLPVGRAARGAIGGALGWTLGYYTPFLFRAVLQTSGGSFSGLAEVPAALGLAALGLLVGAVTARRPAQHRPAQHRPAQLGTAPPVPSKMPSASRPPWAVIGLFVAVLAGTYWLVKRTPRDIPQPAFLGAARGEHYGAIYDADLQRLPHAFRVYEPGPPSSKRVWTQQGYGWTERDPHGTATLYLGLGRSRLGKWDGMVYGGGDDPAARAFIPFQANSPHLWRGRVVAGVLHWHEAGAMKIVP